jgi:hypothetical protein
VHGVQIVPFKRSHEGTGCLALVQFQTSQEPFALVVGHKSLSQFHLHSPTEPAGSKVWKLPHITVSPVSLFGFDAPLTVTAFDSG